jgi:hypothetical protein
MTPARFERGLANYRKRSLKLTETCFHEALAANPFYGPSRM